MKATIIEDVLQKRPFQPFNIQYNGKPVRVDHPEQALFNGSRTILIVVATDDHIHLLNVDHIKAITLSPKRKRAA